MRFKFLCYALAASLASVGLPLPVPAAPHPASPGMGAGKPPMLPTNISFKNDVEPILTRYSCNSGPCHGSQFGKGGFKLSLAGYDPGADWPAITRAARGRRISASDPAHSLLLTKPALETPHAGGLRLKRGSADFHILQNWISSGCPGPNTADPEPLSLSVQPTVSHLPLHAHVKLRVYAQFSDTSVRDVTEHTRISAVNDTLAAVTPEGDATATGYGDGVIMLRYQGLAASAHIISPYPHRQAGKPTAFKPSGFIDRLCLKSWQALNLEPSAPCTDAQFLRRASLDIIGTQPSVDEVLAFEADASPNKRAALVDKLLQRPEYADYWALKWGDLLRNSRAVAGEKGMWAFRNWLTSCFNANRPYDAFVRDLVTAAGSAYTSPAANYYRLVKGPEELAETTAQVFLGTRLQCARCHHHPFEKWSQTDYYRFAAYFARVGSADKSTDRAGIKEPYVTLASSGEVIHPKTGLPQVPTPLSESPVKLSLPGTISAEDRRIELAEWLTSPNNHAFARAVVNRYWSYFLGRGLVHPADDMRVTNPASNPELLEALSADFASHKFDLKRLIRTICTSQVYGLSATPTPTNAQDQVFYSHFLPRRQPAEVLLDSISLATGVPQRFPGLPAGTRAIQLPDASVESEFLDAFGRPPRSSACECERSADPGLIQSLQMLNGDLIGAKVSSREPGSLVATLLSGNRSDAECIAQIYLKTLSRRPNKAEMRTALSALKRRSGITREQGLEDLLWALLNTSEFSSVP